MTTTQLTNRTIADVIDPVERAYWLLQNAKDNLRQEISGRTNGVTRARRYVRECEAAYEAAKVAQ